MIKEITAQSVKKYLKITKIDTDTTKLTEIQQGVLHHLIEATKRIKELYLIQKAPESRSIIKKLKEEKKRELLEIFYIMNGGFNEFDGTYFVEGYEKTSKCGFYPKDLTIEEWDLFYKEHPNLQEELSSPYTVVVRDSEGDLQAVKYCEYYKEELEEIADLLYKAGETTDNFYLKSFLNAQANAFLTNNFEESDIRWIQLAGNTIEPLIGAHEFYDDKFLGYKTSFTSFISIKNELQLQKMNTLLKMVDTLQTILPVPTNYKRNKVEKQSQIVIVDVLYCSGDGRGPVITAAFNLPNSQKIRSEFGAKKVILHNIIKAKFESVMQEISLSLLGETDGKKVSFSSYFNHIILHEISHGLGISLIKNEEGELHDVSYYLKEQYTIIEETKADVMGIYLQFYLIKQCILADSTITESLFTYIIGLIRSIRFGKENAHGIANVIQWNFLMQENAIMVSSENLKISIDLHKIEKSIEKLLTLILTIQGEGNYELAKSFIEKHSKTTPILNEIQNKISDLPIDILPYFTFVGEKEPLTEKGEE